MNQELVKQVVDAVLYEGYILYPYRGTSKKNQQRFTFGRVYPRDFSDSQNGAEPSRMQTEVLLDAAAPDTLLEVTVRFLQPLWREVGKFAMPQEPWAPGTLPEYKLVPELRVGDITYSTWQEALEREVTLPALNIRDLPRVRQIFPFAFQEWKKFEPVQDKKGMAVGIILRRHESISGTVEVAAALIGERLVKLSVCIVNCTPLGDVDPSDNDAIVMRTFVSTHTVLHAEQGSFVSLMDPAAHGVQAAACRNIGTWPVLIGDENAGERDTMLSSPIILYDYPRIAPESPGMLFDGTEIDEILSLRISAMTDDEKREMRQIDEQARRLLERTEALTEADFLRMHGTFREKPQGATVQGVFLKPGDRVRIRPRSRADVMDIALNGKIGIIEAVEQDAEGKIYFPLVLEDDPGKDLGLMRQPGHRFFYGADEIEPLKDGRQ